MTDSDSQGTKPIIESAEESARIFLKNSTAFIIGDFIIKVMGFFFSIFMVRQLGDEQLGVYRTALAYTGILSIMGDLGMTQYATREIARGRRKADELFWDLVIIRLILAVIATAAITSSAAFLPNYDNKVFQIFLACLGFFFHALFGPVSIVLRAHERLEYLSILTTLIQVFFVTSGTFILVADYAEIEGLIIATYLGVPIAGLIGIRFIKQLQFAHLKFQIHPREWGGILQASFPFAMITFTLVAAKDLDTVLLSLWRSDEEVGWYRAAYDLIFKLLFLKTAILAPLAPQMSRHYGASKERVGQSFNFAIKFLWATTLPIAMGSMILAEPLIALAYNNKFPNSVFVLAILIWAFPFLSLSSVCGTVTTASDKERGAVKVYTFAAFVNLITNIIAIPYYGYIGAAASTVLTEIITLGFFYMLIHPEFPLKNINNVLIKPTIAVVVMGGVVFAVQSLPLLVVILIGAITYPITLYLLKPFSEGEMVIIKKLFKSILGRVGIKV